MGFFGCNVEGFGVFNFKGKVVVMYFYFKIKGFFGGVFVEGFVIFEC